MVNWGAWEDSGGNGMRVGIDVDWESISHGEAAATATIKIWTENRFSYDDDQKLNYSGAIGGSQSYHNGAGGSAVLRDTKSYTYTYDSNEYGSSPGSRTFTAKVSGAYNGVTPSKSVTSKIPARPIAAPSAPTNAAVTRISDDSMKVTWTRHSSAGEPYGNLQVDRMTDGGSWSTRSNPGGSATSYTDNNTSANHKYQYRVRAENSAGVSSFDTTGNVWTTPAQPTSPVRTTSGSDQVITWTNNVNYSEYKTEVWHAADGVWDTEPLATVGSGVATYTHVAPSSTISHSYRVRARTSSGATLYSSYSGTTTATVGGTTPPDAPTNLSPNSSSTTYDPTLATTLTWTFNSTDGSPQTQFSIRRRLFGDSLWTFDGNFFTSTSSFTLPANTYANNDTVEWQVMTWGDDPNASPWSESATIIFHAAEIIDIVTKYPVQMDPTSGKLEALTSTSGWPNFVPTGVVLPYASTVAPEGWLLCDGSAVSRTTYARLFALIGTTYGAGDGSTTFNLPDTTNRMLRGGTPGTTGGSDTVTLTTAQLPSHTHSINHDHDNSTLNFQWKGDTDTGTNSGVRVTDIANQTSGGGNAASASINILAHSGDSGSAGSGNAVTVTNPYLAVQYIIKA